MRWKVRFPVATWCRVVVGVAFVAAAVAKLVSPSETQGAVGALLSLPEAPTVAVAHVLPWFELLLGTSLLVHRPRRAAPWIAVATLVAFTLILMQAAWRGIAPDGCACFGSVASGSIHLDVIRNLVLTALAGRATLARAHCGTRKMLRISDSGY